MPARLFALLCLPALLLALSGCPTEELTDPVSTSLSALVGPGEHVAVAVNLDTGETALADPGPTLTQAAADAVAASPVWLRDRLEIRLGMFGDDLQDTLAALILEAPEAALVDEIAFSIANSTEVDLEHESFDPTLFTENAQAVYEFAERLQYAEIVELGDPATGDWQSTVRYALTDADGAAYTQDLAPIDYYWWIVHPRVDNEANVFVDPDTGEPAPAPVGVHWRRYLMESSSDTFDYRDHYMLRFPEDLRDVDLALGATASLGDPSVYPIKLYTDGDGAGLLYEIDIASGTIVASTLDYTWTWADTGAGLLGNVVRYGNTNVMINMLHQVALVVDALPWGDNPYLTAHIGSMDVYTAAELADVDLSTYDKVIVAADQDQAFYEAIAALATPLEDFARDWGVLQLDLHTNADLTGLIFPGGVTVQGGPPADVLYEGQPLLEDYITGAPLLWDGVDVQGDTGERPPPEGTNAFDTIGWWATQNMYDNVSERMEVAGAATIERSWYPQRIVRNHYGNCGELGDLLAGSGRASLMAVRVINSVEDHCWDEVLVGDVWVPWQVDWSDGATRINNPGVGSDEDIGGGKTLSGISSLRGDGLSFSSIEIYSDFVTLEMEVTDEDGDPIDGATVIVATEAFYDDSQLTLAGATYTGLDGVATITVGDQRNYWYWVWSDADGGLDSDGDGDPSTLSVTTWATTTQTAAGATLDEEIELGGDLPLPRLAEVRGDGPAVAVGSATISGAWLSPQGYYTGGHMLVDVPEGAPLRWYLVDAENYDALAAGNAFYALAAAEDARDLALSDTQVPHDELIWLVGVNPTVTTTARVDLELSIRAWMAD